MQGRPLSADEVDQTRKRLVETAITLLETEGRDACSLRRVASEAGISRTTPYTYFDGKESLIEAVRVAALHLLADRCEASLNQYSEVADRLAAVGRAYIGFALERPSLYALIFESAPVSPAYAEAQARYRGLAEAPLREAAALGLTNLPPDRLGHVLWVATHGILDIRRAGKLHGLDFERLLQDLRDTLAFGFVPRGNP